MINDIPLNRRAFVASAAAGLVVPASIAGAVQTPRNRELTGKTICGYQGWFNARNDGRDLKFRHYQTGKGLFEPGQCTIEYWPDVSEFSKEERFDTAFRHKDGSIAQVYSSAHPKTIMRHFQWMRTYGIDGVAIQRFGVNLRNKKQKAHHDDVVKHARTAAKQHGRLWNLMYDLSGMRSGDLQTRIAEDWKHWVDKEGVTEDKTYLRHKGKPLLSIWGVGFGDDRGYSLKDCSELIDTINKDGRFSLMLGIPYYWREQVRDATRDKALHDVLQKADVLSPWAVGRFGDVNNAIKRGTNYLAPDVQWCEKYGKLYLPVAFPGFSWHNYMKSKGEKAKFNHIPRLKGKFLWAQAEAARMAGAKSLYVAMFDEVDEGTAIFKCTNDPPVGESTFLTYEGLPSDHYLWLTGQIARRMRRGRGLALGEIPPRRS